MVGVADAAWVGVAEGAVLGFYRLPFWGGWGRGYDLAVAGLLPWTRLVDKG